MPTESREKNSRVESANQLQVVADCSEILAISVKNVSGKIHKPVAYHQRRAFSLVLKSDHE
jgi:hypothetical protein